MDRRIRFYDNIIIFDNIKLSLSRSIDNGKNKFLLRPTDIHKNIIDP